MPVIFPGKFIIFRLCKKQKLLVVLVEDDRLHHLLSQWAEVIFYEEEECGVPDSIFIYLKYKSEAVASVFKCVSGIIFFISVIIAYSLARLNRFVPKFSILLCTPKMPSRIKQFFKCLSSPVY